jgi:16S rRNA (cytidine1402-2'-O)-methyltransferase
MIPTIIAEDKEEITIPLRVRHVIQTIDVYFVENIRTARRYISKVLRLTPGNSKRVEDLKFHVVNKSTTSDEIASLLDGFRAEGEIGVLSESGCPGIADPGSLVALQGHKKGFTVVPLPGPSSIYLALMGSGLNGQNFTFHGYLPIERKEREKRISQIDSQANKSNQTQIFIETPYRNQHMFESLLHTCSSETMLCVATDLTGDMESISTKSISVWRRTKTELPKSPTVFLLN